MKAAVVTRFGKSWAMAPQKVPKPVPGPGELLVRVHAATVNRSDLGELLHPYLNRLITRANGQRKILGMDFAGMVEAVGPGVTRFKAGDRLFGMCPFSADGAQADYLCIAEDRWMTLLPDSIPFGEGVVCEGAFYAWGSIGRLELPPGSPILIYGASGAIGSAAVQLAKYRGYHVTAAVQPQHLAMAQTLGADRLLDTSSDDYRRLGREYDFILDSVGKMRASQWRPLLKPDGVFATTDAGPRGQSLMLLVWSLITRSGQVTIPVPARGSGLSFVNFLKERMEAGEFRAVIDRTYPLNRIAEAYSYVQTGQKAGIVVIEVAPA
jgi:NADPH:quinone reductase-like Zn-dependent oxidoreductase